MIKVLLALLMIRETQRFEVTSGALRVLYRKQINKHTISTHLMHKENSNKRSNKKVQLKNSGLQKESNRTKQRNSNGKRNKLRLLIWTKVKFYSSKILFNLVKQKEGFETKLQALESSDFDKRAKSYTRTKIRAEIVIENNHGKPWKKKN